MIKNKKIKFNDLSLQWEKIKDEALPRVIQLMQTCSFINGPDVSNFEENFAKYIGTKFACGVSNGTDAIKLCVEALELKGKIGVLIPANTFIATILGVEMAFGHYNENIEYILVDCDDYYQMDLNLLEIHLKNNRDRWDSCIIIPVHLYGNATDMNEVMQLSDKYNCFVIEDCSQAHGTTLTCGKRVGSFGHMAAFSLYPGKNLGCAGDGGVITTNNKKYYESIKLLRSWGAKKKYYYDRKGYNNRLDSLQAIIVDEKLKYLDEWNSHRETVAQWYEEFITNSKIILPKKSPCCKNHTYHIYCVRLNGLEREKVMEILDKNNIECGIHYPIPIEQTVIYSNRWFSEKTREYSLSLLSLPIHPFMEKEEVIKISEIINDL